MRTVSTTLGTFWTSDILLEETACVTRLNPPGTEGQGGTVSLPQPSIFRKGGEK